MDSHDLVLLAKARHLSETGQGGAVRVAAGLSLREVADAVGLSPSALWRWECAQRSPRGIRAVAWARLIGDLRRASSAA